jgi:hypothetical protein
VRAAPARPKVGQAFFIVGGSTLALFAFGVLCLALLRAVWQVPVTWECTMNGYGTGQCTFTNPSPHLFSSSACGYVGVSRVGSSIGQSAVFCSGDVAPHSTTQVSFSIPAVSDGCGTTNGSPWTKVCSFDFVPSP